MIPEEDWLAIWNGPDLDAVRALSADDLEVTAVTADIEPRYYAGPDAAVRWLVELQQRLQANWVVTKRSVLADDAVVTEGELRFHEPTTTGAERQTFAILMRFRGDKLRWVGTFMTLQAAREAWQLGVGT
ncbi:MAG TPA: nuclear transport factor 2 family protein [Thermoleophilaceae bacterium]|nr:nuclear transport factor 2 family protein [Thermoleophilaceae bacterium]